MRVLRERWFLLTCSALVAAAVMLAAWTASSSFKRGWWARIAAQPLTADEAAALDGCGELEWSTWLKVLATDPDLACGEGWAAAELGSAAGGTDKRAWLEARVTAADSRPGARMRAATALTISGVQPAREPMFLLQDLDEPRAEAWLAAAVDDEALALQLGPRGVALRVIALVDRGEVEPRHALPVVRWLASVEDPTARRAADRALTRLAAVPEEVGGRTGDRQRRNLLVGGAPTPAGSGLAGCTDLPCLEPRVRALESMTREAADGGPDPEPEEPPGEVPAELAEPGSLAAAALAWEVQALRRWLDAAPDRDARLRELLGRPARGSVLGLGWDGSGTPWAVAQVVQLLGDAPVDVRADRADTVWMVVGRTWVARSCGTPSSEPSSTPFDDAAIRARVLLERARDDQRSTALAHARVLDPGLPPPPPQGDPVAFRIGATLAPPTRPDGDRGVGPDGPWCP